MQRTSAELVPLLMAYLPAASPLKALFSAGFYYWKPSRRRSMERKIKSQAGVAVRLLDYDWGELGSAS